jgi:3-isopropylmalate/(R)-2-methylmalate dehydratase small subunit
MEKFVRFTAKACPLPLPNLNTDQIIPARYLKWPRSKGLAVALFHDLRRDPDGNERPDFPLNQARYENARVLIGGRNFGGGSSREAAVYALCDAGFRCVIAPSFGDIFAQNSIKNGLLPAVLPEDDAAHLANAVTAHPEQDIVIDLDRQTIIFADLQLSFAIDPVSRNQLLNGWDDVDLTETHREAIASFKTRSRKERPWAMPQNRASQ